MNTFDAAVDLAWRDGGGAGLVLVVEDHEVLRSALRRILEDTGYEVHESASARGAALLAKRLRPDVVLLDLELPDGTGWDVIRQLRNLPATRSSEVVLLSGRVAQGEADRAADLGVQFLAKPATAATILAAVRSCISEDGVHTLRARGGPAAAEDISQRRHLRTHRKAG